MCMRLCFVHTRLNIFMCIFFSHIHIHNVEGMYYVPLVSAQCTHLCHVCMLWWCTVHVVPVYTGTFHYSTLPQQNTMFAVQIPPLTTRPTFNPQPFPVFQTVGAFKGGSSRVLVGQPPGFHGHRLQPRRHGQTLPVLQENRKNRERTEKEQRKYSDNSEGYQSD